MPPGPSGGCDGQEENTPSDPFLSEGLSLYNNTFDDLRDYYFSSSSSNDPNLPPWSPCNPRAQRPHRYEVEDRALNHYNHAQNLESTSHSTVTDDRFFDGCSATSITETPRQYQPIAPRPHPSAPTLPSLNLVLPQITITTSHTDFSENISNDIIRCSQCDRQFTGIWRHSNFTRHHKSVHGNTPLICRAYECSKSYKRSDARNKHEREHHPELKSTLTSTNQNADPEFSKNQNPSGMLFTPAHAEEGIYAMGDFHNMYEQHLPSYAHSCDGTSDLSTRQGLSTESSYSALATQTDLSSIPCQSDTSHLTPGLAAYCGTCPAGTALECSHFHQSSGPPNTASLANPTETTDYIDPSLLERRRSENNFLISDLVDINWEYP